MKNNLLTIIILALLIVNIILTGIMMISFMGTNKKTADLVSDIAAVLNLELGVEEEEEVVEIPMSQQTPWAMEGAMTIPLQSEQILDENGNVISTKEHYIMFNVSFSLYTKGDGYKDYGETFGDYESLIQDAINSTVSKHTIDECRNDFETVREEMLEAVKGLFDKNEFIYKIAISEIKYQ